MESSAESSPIDLRFTLEYIRVHPVRMRYPREEHPCERQRNIVKPSVPDN